MAVVWCTPGLVHVLVTRIADINLRCRHMSGRVHLWDYLSRERTVTFNGHRGAVTSLTFNAKATLLASGSRDTDVIVWDVVSESGLFRYGVVTLARRDCGVCVCGVSGVDGAVAYTGVLQCQATRPP